MGPGGLAAMAAKRAAIMAQIGKLRIKIAKARAVITNLNNSNTALDNALMQWTRRYAAFQSSAMSEVVVADKFEGESAEKIRTRLPDAIQKMTDTQSSTGNVQCEIGIQITKLEEYIAKLEEEIAALMSEMMAI